MNPHAHMKCTEIHYVSMHCEKLEVKVKLIPWKSAQTADALKKDMIGR